MDGWVDEWMDEWADGHMDGWMDQGQTSLSFLRDDDKIEFGVFLVAKLS